jgi:hypothetical protein
MWYLKPHTKKRYSSDTNVVDGEITQKKRYSSDTNVVDGEITHQQLQRLLDEDKAMRILMGTNKSKDIIKKFK